MKTEFVPPFEVQRQRNAWFKQQAKPGMTLTEVMQLNEEVFRHFPHTEEERRLKAESLKDVPEFVL
jgi:hypothetical protein